MEMIPDVNGRVIMHDKLLSLVVICPYCKSQHVHGAGAGKKENPVIPDAGYYGIRGAHCGGNQYYNVVPHERPLD